MSLLPNIFPVNKSLAALALVGGLFSGAALGALNDVVPADYFPLANGTTSLTFYAYDRTAHGPYQDGRKMLDGTSEAQVAALRLVRFVDVGGHPFSLLAVLPWSTTTLEPPALARAFGRQASGGGDVRLGAATWLKADRASGEYLGLTALVFVPTGSYERTQVLNIGENRYRYTLNAGWIKPLGRSLVLDVVPEVAWYGDNKAYLGDHRLAQRPSYALTGYLRYQHDANWQLFAGGQINRGGETRVDGVDQRNAPDNNRAIVGATFLNDRQTDQWIVRLAKDTSIRNGFRLDQEVMLRYMRMF